MEQLLTPRQAADILGLSVHTLTNRRAQGKAPRFVKLADGQVRYKAEALRACVLEAEPGAHDAR